MAEISCSFVDEFLARRQVFRCFVYYGVSSCHFSAETHEIIKQFDLPKTGTLYMGSRWTPDSKAVTYRDNSYGYWIQPIDGGEPRRLDGLPTEKFYNMAWSKDGEWFALVRGQEIRDVVLLTKTAP